VSLNISLEIGGNIWFVLGGYYKVAEEMGVTFGLWSKK
jgi:hypothetical protein